MALWVLPHCWAHLAGVSGGGKIYSWFMIVIKIYPALSTAIGGRDWMDCSRRLWMSSSIYITRHQSQRSGMVFVIGDVGQFFSQKYIHKSIAMIYLCLFHPFLCHWGGGNGWMVSGSFAPPSFLGNSPFLRQKHSRKRILFK